MTDPQINTTKPFAVVLGLSPTGLYAIRELARAGIPVIGCSDTRNAAAASRYLRDVIIAADPARRLERLMALETGHTGKPVLIPTSDQDIEFITDNADTLAGKFAFQKSYADGIGNMILTKETFYEECEKRGVAYPTLRTGMANDLAALAGDISYPCMIKPSRIHEIKAEMAGRKGWIVRDEAEFYDALADVPKNAGMLICQDIVACPESEITLFCAYFDGKGGVHQPFTSRKLRQYPPGFGSAATVQSSDEHESAEIATKLLLELNYEGIGAAEFKRDPNTGVLKIIEINPRPSLWFSVSEAAGKTVTLAAYNALTGAALPMETPQKDGVRWRYRGKDIYAALFYKLKKDFILKAPDMMAVGPAKAYTYPVYAPDDPKPAFTEVRTLLGKGVNRIARKLRGGR